MLASPARAATIYWAGAAGNWSSGSSWVGGTAPGSSDTASFQGYAGTSPSSILYTPSTYTGYPSSNMRDGNDTTHWWSGANQASGQCVIVDLGSAKTISGIEIDAGTAYPADYGRGFDIYVSSTNNNTCGHASWNSAIASKAGSAVTRIAFTPVTYRYVKIQLNTTANPTAWWAIGEVTLYATGGSSVTATISASTTVAAVDMGSAVTVTQAAGQDLTVTGDMTVGSGTTFNGSSGDLTVGDDLTVSGGTFTGSSGDVRVTDDLVYSSGTFTAPSGLLQVGGAFTSTSSFTHNSGRVLLTSTASETFATGGATFNNLFINDGLVGYWKLDDGTTPAVDSSGYGHSATLTNTPTWAAGPTTLQFTNGNAMVLTNASSEYGRVSRTTALEPTKVSISAWIKRNATQVQYSKIVSKTYNNDGSNPYGTYLLQLNYTGGAANYGQVVFHTGHTGPTQNILLSTSSNAAPSGTWTHVVATYDPAASAPQKKLYINGVLDNSATVSTALLYDTGSTGDFFIGSGGGGTYFDGTIDDVRVYNRAISAADVAALYAGAHRVTPVGTQTLNAALTTAGDLNLVSGTLDVSATGCTSAPCGVTVGASWYNFGGAFTPRTGTVTLNGTGSRYIQSDRNAFYRLTLGSTGTGTWTLLDRLYVSSVFTEPTLNNLATSTYPMHAATITKTGGALSGTGAVVLDAQSNQSLTLNSVAAPLRIESPLDDGLVGYWKLDEGRGSTATDLSGGGRNATTYNNPIWTTDVPSGIPIDDAAGLTLNGSNQYVRVSRAAAL
ncbi:MAG TPA: LamG-like jellyroll fold domain-containing protein, partial [Polyangia bacterium]